MNEFTIISDGTMTQKLAKSLSRTVYISIGVPFSNIPIMTKVASFVDFETDTRVTVAKKLRKMVADHIENHGWVKGTKFNPIELYYEIYETYDAEKPILASGNSPTWKKEK